MRFLFYSASLIAMSFWVVGCADKAAPDAATPVSATPSEQHDLGHEHPSKGPHDGDLIELGDEEYHAEFVHNEDSGDVTIYILDSSAKKAVPIELTEVIVNLKHDGKPEQHKLAAAPLDGETGGKSSRFIAKDNHDLAHGVEEENADARLQVTIAGKNYSGKIEHDHDHGAGDEHDHGHDHKEEKK